MKIVFLGTNGWYDTRTGNTLCTLIETAKEYLILDAGNGLYKIDKYIKNKKPIYIFLSHFHLDHIIGLHILNKFNFKQGLHIYGQIGTRRILKQIVNKPFTVPFVRLPFNLTIHELSEGIHYTPFYVKCKFLVHSSRCLGYRFELENKIITYCTDTAFCKSAIDLAKRADLLISECSYKIGQQNDRWPHLDPLSSARIAKEANAKRLVLIHFDADIYQALKERRQAQVSSQRVFGNVLSALDNMQIEV